MNSNETIEKDNFALGMELVYFTIIMTVLIILALGLLKGLSA